MPKLYTKRRTNINKELQKNSFEYPPNGIHYSQYRHSSPNGIHYSQYRQYPQNARQYPQNDRQYPQNDRQYPQDRHYSSNARQYPQNDRHFSQDRHYSQNDRHSSQNDRHYSQDRHSSNGRNSQDRYSSQYTPNNINLCNNETEKKQDLKPMSKFYLNMYDRIKNYAKEVYIDNNKITDDFVRIVRNFSETWDKHSTEFLKNNAYTRKIMFFKTIYRGNSSDESIILNILKDEYVQLFRSYREKINNHTNNRKTMKMIDFFMYIGRYIDIKNYLKSEKINKCFKIMGKHFCVEITDKLISKIKEFIKLYLDNPFGSEPGTLVKSVFGNIYTTVINIFEIFSYNKHPIDTIGVKLFVRNFPGYTFTGNDNFPINPYNIYNNPNSGGRIQYSEIDLDMRTGLNFHELLVNCQIMQIIRYYSCFYHNIKRSECGNPIVVEYIGIINKNMEEMVENNIKLKDKLSSTNEQLKLAENKLHSTEKQLELAENKLHSTEKQLELAENKLHSTEKQLELANNKLYSTEKQLELANNKLKSTRCNFINNPEKNINKTQLNPLNKYEQIKQIISAIGDIKYNNGVIKYFKDYANEYNIDVNYIETKYFKSVCYDTVINSNIIDEYLENIIKYIIKKIKEN